MRGGTGRYGIADLNLAVIAAILTYAIVKAATGEGIHLTGDVAAQAGDLLAFGLTCGLLSYGTIEAAKRLLPLRGFLQLRETGRWLRLREMERPRRLEEPEQYPGNAGEQLLSVLGLQRYGPEVLRVFNLPVEQLAAQIGTAVDVALGSAPRYQRLVDTLAGPMPGTQEGASSPSAGDPFALTQRVRAGIDRLQISLGEQWRRAVQGATLSIAGLYGIGLVHAAHLADRAEPRYVLAALLLGGPIAWTLRDAAALVERARR